MVDVNENGWPTERYDAEYSGASSEVILAGEDPDEAGVTEDISPIEEDENEDFDDDDADDIDEFDGDDVDEVEDSPSKS